MLGSKTALPPGADLRVSGPEVVRSLPVTPAVSAGPRTADPAARCHVYTVTLRGRAAVGQSLSPLAGSGAPAVPKREGTDGVFPWEPGKRRCRENSDSWCF